MDFATAVDAISSLKIKINSLRTDDKFQNFVQRANDFTSNVEIEDPPRRPKRSRIISQRACDSDFVVHDNIGLLIRNDNDERFTLKTDFYFVLIDRMATEMDKRFSESSCEILANISALNPNKWGEDKLGNVTALARKFEIDAQPVEVEYMLMFESKFFSDMKSEFQSMSHQAILPSLLTMFKKCDMAQVYPNIYRLIIMIAVLPVTTATCERSHSKVKIINNYLRAKMVDDRLETLLIISCESDIAKSLDLNDLVSNFALQPRKIRL